MADLIVGAIVLAIIGAAVSFIIKEKKRGVKCVGCPYAEDCAKRKSGNGCSDEKI